MHTIICKCCKQECSIEKIGISFNKHETDAKDGDFYHVVHPENGESCMMKESLYSSWTWQLTDIEEYKKRVELLYIETLMMFFI